MFKLARQWIFLLSMVVPFGSALPAYARVDSSSAPGRLYPAHTRLIDLPQVTNQQMDCKWGFSCEEGQPVTSAPIFHFQVQDALHRLGGWARFGNRTGFGPTMLFALFASRYNSGNENGLPWNVSAFSDFRGALMSRGYGDLDLAHIPRLVPPGTLGNASVQLAHTADGDILAMACWTRSVEVEAIAIFVHGSMAQYRLAFRALTRQMRAALRTI